MGMLDNNGPSHMCGVLARRSDEFVTLPSEPGTGARTFRPAGERPDGWYLLTDGPLPHRVSTFAWLACSGDVLRPPLARHRLVTGRRSRTLLRVFLILVLGLSVGCSSSSRAPSRADGAPGTTAGATSAENTLPGARWALTKPAAPGELEGWLDRVSIAPGDPLHLYVNSTDPSWTVTAFRIGWYGGLDGRKLWTSAPQHGVRQPPPRVSGPGTVSALGWRRSLTITTQGWPAGDYLLRLDGAPDGRSSYVPVTLRGPSAAGRLVVVNAVTTWQAYNHWGGYSLYAGPDGARADRARVVSFDRPYDYGNGAADFTGNESPLVELAERIGLPLDYVTDVDLQEQPHLLDGALGVLSLGHDEYWSPQMRARLTTARDAGVSIAFLGANAVYRRIRFESDPLGPDRLEVNYKSAAEDPITRTDPAANTGNWPDPPAADDEGTLTGESYRCNPAQADLVFTGSDGWLLAGTGVRAGTRLPGQVGSEYDGLASSRPRPIDDIAHSPLTCKGRRDASDVTWYTTPSGAGVFDAGTSSWVCALNDGCAPGHGGTNSQKIVTGITSNLLRAMAAGSAGRRHPASGHGS